MKNYFFILILINQFFCSKATAYEVDNFTNRYDSLTDSKNYLNQFMNSKLQSVLDSINLQKSKTCIKKDIIAAVKQELASDSNSSRLKSELEKYAGASSNIQRHTIDVNKSIYSKRSFSEKIKGFMLTSAGIDPSINLNGQYVGIDKLGHFLYEGYWYYDVYKNDPTRSGLKQILNNGLNSEKEFFGQQTTGVKSYADMAANYEGFLFWNNIYGGSDPYFSCTNGKWLKIRDFSWSDYVSASWDEGINCSEYNTDDLKKAIQNQFDVLTKINSYRKNKPKFACPMSVSECSRIKTKYDKLKKYLIGPDCINATISSPDNYAHSAQKATQIESAKSSQAPGANASLSAK